MWPFGKSKMERRVEHLEKKLGIGYIEIPITFGKTKSVFDPDWNLDHITSFEETLKSLKKRERFRFPK